MKKYDVKEIPDRAPRLFEIIRMAAQGYEYKEIAKEMWVAHSTVKSATFKAYRDYGAKNITELVSMCHKAGIL